MPDSEDMSPEPRRPGASAERDVRTGQAAAAARIAQQNTWVDLQIRQAMERGQFDNLPGQGKPIADLGMQHDPDWWIKKLVERENLALLPPALALRTEDAGLDDTLDKINVESEVRREVEDFNARVVKAIHTPSTGPSGPPVITRQRDVEAEVAAWQERRAARVEAQRAAQAATGPAPQRRPWWRRWRTG